VSKPSRPKIFLSYRRSDADARAGRLADALRYRTTADVFLDVESLRPGEHFPERLRVAVAETDLMLVLIGPTWSRVSGADGAPRLHEPEDWVRAEIRTALEHGRTIIPLLVERASMPVAEDLPDDIRALSSLTPIELRDGAYWNRDVDALVEDLPRVERLDRSAANGPALAVRSSRLPSVAARASASTIDAVLYFAVFHDSVLARPDRGRRRRVLHCVRRRLSDLVRP
jgi:hypothetical protein